MIEQKKPQLKCCKELHHVQLARSLHDPWTLTCAQHKKLFAKLAPVPGGTTDTSTTSGASVSTVSTVPLVSPVQDYNSQNAPPSTLSVETAEDDDSFLDSPRMPGLRAHHPSSTSNAEDSHTFFLPLDTCFSMCFPILYPFVSMTHF